MCHRNMSLVGEDMLCFIQDIGLPGASDSPGEALFPRPPPVTPFVATVIRPI